MCPDIDWNKPLAVQFIRDYVEQAGADGVVLGVSGGLDSAVCMALCAKAVDGEKSIAGLWMPYGDADTKYIDQIKKMYTPGIIQTADITKTVDSFKTLTKSGKDKLRLGNIMARTRMTILYDFAKRFNLLVVGTSNRSEIMTGYTTKWGDGACDLAPIANLYKYEVVKMAKDLGVPDEIIQRPPSADLWEGQTDEDELGISYEDLDNILEGIEAITKSDIPINTFATRIRLVSEHGIGKIDHVVRLIQSSLHKRQQTPNPKTWCKS